MVLKIGDIHRNFKWLVQLFGQFPSGTTFIQAGDFGAGLSDSPDIEQDWFNLIQETLEENQQTFFAIRGNHDNPSYFNGQYMLGRFNLVPDYHTEIIEGKKYLFIGGATSIDRTRNIEGLDYWPDEIFKLDWPKLQSARDIEVVVTHNAPDFAPPLLIGKLVMHYALGTKDIVDSNGKVIERGYPADPELLGDLRRERMLITAAFQELKRNNPTLHAWFYGHFHNSATAYVDGVKFKLLDINEVVE